MLHAASDELVSGFANFLKRIVFEAETCARIGFSGSSMITFLNSVRLVRPNGFHFFTQSKYVLLGRELSPQWATRIACDIKRAMVGKQPSSPLSSPALTTELLLRSIRGEKNKLSVRPAIIQQLLFNFDRQHLSVVSVEDVEAKLSQSLRTVTLKMGDETVPDFMLALCALRNDRSFLKSLRLLAAGNACGSDLFNNGPPNEANFAALLCGEDEFRPDIVSRLGPPYAHLCMQFILPETGDIALDLSQYRKLRTKSMSARFQSMLNACAESAGMFNHIEQAFISQSVVDVLSKNGIHAKGPDGASIPVRSVFDHPLLTSMHQASLKKYPRQFQKERDAYDALIAPSEAALPIGMRVLTDLRHIQSHLVEYADFLTLKGWSVVVLEELAAAFSDCLPRCSVPYDMTAAGYAVVSQAAIDEFKTKQREKPTQKIDPVPAPPVPPASTASGHAPASQKLKGTSASSQKKSGGLRQSTPSHSRSL